VIRTLAFLLASAFVAPAAGPIEGNPKSPVRVIIYENLQCSDCAVFRKMLDDQLLPKYGDKVAFEHRDFPLAKHAWARPAALTARHFDQAKPGLGIVFRRAIMEDRKTVQPETLATYIGAFARKHKVKVEPALASLDDPALAAAVEKDFQEGVARGVSKTPTIFVDGTPFIETFTFEEVAKALDAALKAN
jgi:protein-disulfide isomerase